MSQNGSVTDPITPTPPAAPSANRYEVAGSTPCLMATERPRSLAARAVRQIIDRFCQGSVEELVSGMVDAKMLSKSEMSRLEEFVRDQREKGK